MHAKKSPLGIERLLGEITKHQLGLVTTRQAARKGVGQDALLERVEGRLLERCHPGVYRHLLSVKSFEQQCLAACLAVNRSVLTGRAAALVHGLPMVTRPQSPEIVLPRGFTYRGSGIAVRQTRHPFESEPWITGRITTVGATLMVLAGDLDSRALARCIDHALVNRLISVPRLLADVEARPSARFAGRTTLIAELEARGNGRVLHRSLNERRVAGWLRRLGVDGAQPNFMVTTPLGDIEVDFAWPGDRVALEVSPFHTHGSEEKQRRDAFRRRALTTISWRTVEATDADIAEFNSFVPIAQSIIALLAA